MDPVFQVRRILCPVDFSEQSTGAMLYATQVASLFEAEAHLLHATVVQGFGELDAFPSCSVLESTIRDRAETALNRLLAGESSAHLQVHREVRPGIAPAEVILNYVGAREIDLVVMATHGRRGPRKIFLGGVTEEVVRMCRVPVLTVSGAVSMTENERGLILACVDDKAIGQEVVDAAGRFARWAGSDVMLLRAVERADDTAIESAYSDLQSLAEQAGIPADTVRYKVIDGDPTDTILSTARSYRPDLIVLGSDRTASDGTLLGSVAERVLQRANCSALTIKQQAFA